MDKIVGQLGYLQLNEDGAVVASSGDLQNDEKSAQIFMNLLTMTNQIDPSWRQQQQHQQAQEAAAAAAAAAVGLDEQDSFKRLTISYDDHCYVVCLSNRKVHVVKRSKQLQQQQQQQQIVV